jgi:osmoprotectant transport system substrate-binding protein
MFTARNKGRLALAAVAVGAALALSGCASGDPLDTPESGSGGEDSNEAIVVGSQQYYSNEIIAEIYAQALENAGYTVERQFQIGQRDAYMPEVESGAIDLFPEYTGNLLQFYVKGATETAPDAVYDALVAALPEGLTALDYSPATDQDSYNVTADFAEENGVSSLADLAGMEGLVLGGAPELEERPYGPSGLADIYGLDVEFQATGETTVESLTEGIIDIANVYSADPSIAQYDLVTLDDPEGMFLSSNVVPITSSDIAEEVGEVIDPISAAMTPDALVEMNLESVQDEQNPATIATAWLTDNDLLD